MSRWSLRTRLTVLYGGLFLLAGAALLAILYFVVQYRLDQQLRTAESSRIEKLRQQASTAPGSIVTLPDGSTVTITAFVRQVRAQQEAIKNAALSSLLTEGAVAVAVVAVAAGLAGRAVAGRALLPLHVMTATAERIASSRGPQRDLRERIGLTGRNDDVGRLSGSFDAMLDSLEQAFDNQRRFVANASHELRTPLATQRALIELEITKPAAAPDTVHLGKSLLVVNERQTRLIEGLLFLADSENELEHPVPVDLGETARHVLASTLAPAHAPAVKVSLGHAPVTGDPVLLEQLIRNLVENALRYNTPGGWIDVTTRTERAHATLDVSNTGPVVPAHEVGSLFEPFRRLQGTGPEGAVRGLGLGLSIVKAVATTHGGTVTANAREDGGLRVTVRIPSRS
jgi:signal transduction histidine kinase